MKSGTTYFYNRPGVSNRVPRTVLQSVKALACLFAAVAALHADPLGDVFARMDKTAQTFKGMTADIRQTAHTAIINDDSIETGTIRLRKAKPGDTRVLVDYTKPDPKTISVEGQEVKLYLRKANVVQVYDIGNKRAALDQAMLLGFGATSNEIKAAYDVTWVGQENVNGQASGHLKLVPKSKEVQAQLKQADLWIADTYGAPVQQKLLTSNAGDYTQFTYSNLKFTGSLSDKDLRLNPQKGAQTQHVGK